MLSTVRRSPASSRSGARSAGRRTSSRLRSASANSVSACSGRCSTPSTSRTKASGMPFSRATRSNMGRRWPGASVKKDETG